MDQVNSQVAYLPNKLQNSLRTTTKSRNSSVTFTAFIDKEAEITGIMELANAGFHIAIINMFKDLKENINTINKGVEIILRANKILELKNIVFSIKKLPDGLNIRLDAVEKKDK